jgi:endonuclease/exonuclease/phosphatase (EEP) superfamily protein YafD
MDLIRAVAFLLGAAAAAAAALAVCGAFSDRLDIFAQASPLWFAMGLAALILQLLAGSERWTLAPALVAMAIAALLIGPDVVAGFAAPRAAPAGQTLKLIQFNVWDRNRDPAATARWILSQDPDIVVLEELGGGEVPAALAARYPNRTPCEPTCATIILSKAPPTAGAAMDWPGLGSRHEGAWASFGRGQDAFTVAGVHYKWPIPPGPQRDQARRFADGLAGFDRRSLIVAGDFNMSPWSWALKRQDARLGIPRLTHALFTWPAGPISHWRLNLPFAILAIDHIYAGPAWKVVSVSRGPVLGSDHYPIVTVLTR